MENLPPIKLDNLKNKCVIVTGAASGLGQATAIKFAENGAYVTIADIQDEAGQKTADELCKKGYKATFVEMDVTNWASTLAAFKHAVNFSPRMTLDIAALYAGLLSGDPNLPRAVALADPEPTLERDPKESEYKVLKTNLVGEYRCAELALHYFRLKPPANAPEVSPGKKALILIASLAAYVDHAPTEYGAAKWGVRGLFRSLRYSALEKDSTFTVNVLAPGMVLTSRGAYAAKPPPEHLRTFLMELVVNPKYHASIEYVVDAACLCATNDEVNGRSFSMWPSGWVDNEESPPQGDGIIAQQIEKSGYLEAMHKFRHSV